MLPTVSQINKHIQALLYPVRKESRLKEVLIHDKDNRTPRKK
jgi:hypothetical protein